MWPNRSLHTNRRPRAAVSDTLDLCREKLPKDESPRVIEAHNTLSPAQR